MLLFKHIKIPIESQKIHTVLKDNHREMISRVTGEPKTEVPVCFINTEVLKNSISV